MEEDGLTSIENKLRAAGILGAKDYPTVKSDQRNLLHPSIGAAMADGAQFSIDLNMPTKKVFSYS